MLAAMQMLFLACLLGAVGWLAYLAHHQDAAAGDEAREIRGRAPRWRRGRFLVWRP